MQSQEPLNLAPAASPRPVDRLIPLFVLSYPVILLIAMIGLTFMLWIRNYDSLPSQTWALFAALGICLLLTAALIQSRRYRRRELLQAQSYSLALERLNTVSVAISAKLGNGQEALRDLLAAALEFTGTTIGSIIMVEQDEFGETTVRPIVQVGHYSDMAPRPQKLKDLQTARIAIEQQRILVIEETQNTDLPVQILQQLKFRSIIQLPLLNEGRTIGLMSLGDFEPHIFTETQRRLARLWGAQAAVTLANARLYFQAQLALKSQQQMIEQRDRLSSVTATIYAQTSLEGTINRISELTPSVLGVDICGVILTTNHPGQWLLAAASAPINHLAGTIVNGRYPPVERMLAQRKIRIVTDASLETDLHPIWQKVPNVGSFMNVPMFQSDGQPLGFITLVRSSIGEFSREQVALAQLFAARAATAIENARLHQQAYHDAQANAVLLRELNHRVKNNLAGIAGLIEAAEESVTPESRPTLHRLVHRIRMMGQTHELFVGGVTAIGLDALIDQVLASLAVVRPADVDIHIDLEDVPIQLRTDRAVSLAMVLHELTFNAIVHGTGAAGQITIRAQLMNASTLRIEIIDTGLPAADVESAPVATLTSTGIGLQLVTGLVRRELRGKFDLLPVETGGTRAVVEFPLADEITEGPAI